MLGGRWVRKGKKQETDRDYYSCPEIRVDGGLDQSSSSGDGKKKKRHMDLGTILEREVIGHLPMSRCEGCESR